MDFEDDYYDKDPYTDDGSDKLDSDEEEKIRSYYAYNVFKPIEKPLENGVIDLANSVKRVVNIKSSESSIEEGGIITIPPISEKEEIVPTKIVYEVQDIGKSTYQASDFLNYDVKPIPRYFNSIPSSLKCHHCTGNHLIKDCPQKDNCMTCKKSHKRSKCPLTMMCFNCKKLGHSIKECTEKFAKAGCYHCGSTIHSSKDCTNFWRIYSIEKNMKTVYKPKPGCSSCGLFGHYSDDCPNKFDRAESAFKDLETILYQQNIKGVNIKGRIAENIRPNHFYLKGTLKGGRYLHCIPEDLTDPDTNCRNSYRTYHLSNNDHRRNRYDSYQFKYQSNSYYNTSTHDNYNDYSNSIYTASYGNNNIYNQSTRYSNNYNNNTFNTRSYQSKKVTYNNYHPYSKNYHGNS